MTTPDDAEAGLDAASTRLLERTRSWVLNVLVVDGLSLLASALVIRGLGTVDLGFDRVEVKRFLHGALFVVLVPAFMVTRTLGGRGNLTDPDTRARRYFVTRVTAAAIGWGAMPLGLAYGLLVDPGLGAVAPFWLAAMVVASLAFPRSWDLEGFRGPMPDGREPQP